MNKLKLFLFNLLEKSLNIFGRLGVNKKTPGAFRIYNFLFKSFWPYPNIIEIQGSKIFIKINDESYAMRKTFEAYTSSRIHEIATTELFKKIIKNGNVIVDLGANIGYFTLLAAKLVGEKGKVYAFEPEPKNYSYLQKNIKLNNYNQVIALQKAVSDRKGKTKLYICLSDSGHHTINRYNGIEAYKPNPENSKEVFVEVETITLDEFFKGKEESIDVMKMDVEGAEALVLAGMDEILRKNKKLKMFVEFFPLLIEKMGSSPRDFIQKLLKDYNFSIFVIPGDYDASQGKMLKINSVNGLMELFKGEKGHVNLFIKRQ